MVNAYSRSKVEERLPLVGCYAFTHCSDLHIKAFNKDKNAYCWIKDYPNQKQYQYEKINNVTYVNDSPKVISATELKYHRKGPGNRYLMMDERVAPNVKQYCIVREIDVFCEEYPSYVDVHVHHCDSLFLFLGSNPGYIGLKVMVQLENEEFEIESPASVFIPSGVKHTYKVIRGQGTFVNHVLSGNYNDSLLEVAEVNNIIELTK
jgi:2-isopropylmalate synthase